MICNLNCLKKKIFYSLNIVNVSEEYSKLAYGCIEYSLKQRPAEVQSNGGGVLFSNFQLAIKKKLNNIKNYNKKNPPKCMI